MSASPSCRSDALRQHPSRKQLFRFLFRQGCTLLASPLPPENQLPVGGCAAASDALPRPDPASMSLSRRAFEAGVAFAPQALSGPLESLIAGAWAWYESRVFSRCHAWGILGRFCRTSWAFIFVEKMLEATIVCSTMSLHIEAYQYMKCIEVPNIYCVSVLLEHSVLGLCTFFYARLVTLNAIASACLLKTTADLVCVYEANA